MVRQRRVQDMSLVHGRIRRRPQHFPQQSLTVPNGLSFCKLQVADEPSAMKNFGCIICLEIMTDPVETQCCHNLFCSSCITQQPLQNCPCCRAPGPTIVPNVPVKRMIDDLPVSCNYCNKSGTRGEFGDHMRNCSGRPLNCNICGHSVIMEQAISHLQSHMEEVLRVFFS
ncbi:hypothetical protein RCL1_008065 [Eukaryota sp. TZLM3-RCL]